LFFFFRKINGQFNLFFRPAGRDTFSCVAKKKCPKRRPPDKRIHLALRRFSLSVARQHIPVLRATSAIHRASLRAHGQSVTMLGCAETGNNNRGIGKAPNKSL
jgi:hypothetical protein